MRRNTPIPIIGSLIVIIIGCLFCVPGCVRRTVYPVFPVPYDQNGLVGTWVGFNDKDETCYTLILGQAGDGVLHSHFDSGTIATNLVSHWGIQGCLLRCEFKQKDAPMLAASLACNVHKGLLVATLTGVGGWKEKVVFRRSEVLERSLGNAKTVEEVLQAVPQKR